MFRETTEKDNEVMEKTQKIISSCTYKFPIRVEIETKEKLNPSNSKSTLSTQQPKDGATNDSPPKPRPPNLYNYQLKIQLTSQEDSSPMQCFKIRF
jgi:hypothetical protein